MTENDILALRLKLRMQDTAWTSEWEPVECRRGGSRLDGTNINH
jgi:hypothetical protein